MRLLRSGSIGVAEGAMRLLGSGSIGAAERVMRLLRAHRCGKVSYPGGIIGPWENQRHRSAGGSS
ncbi:hypothetical protein Acsp01_03560 [Actinoplanes sp. NBRC 101535]|nr:hypothetical protein Acsp01_03560 [Actinoplanes sp. NBRC 101535]